MELRKSRRITRFCGRGVVQSSALCRCCCRPHVPALLAFAILVAGRGGATLASEGIPTTRPVSRMGDPWGMIYGGSGWWEHNNPHRTNIGERAAAGAKETAKWGVRASRVGVCWHDVERERGTYDWTMPDAVIPAVSEAGIHVALCVATTPRWAWQHPGVEAILIERGQANLAGCLPHKPEFWPDYERYLTEVVKRYRASVKHYEIWNEPDGMAGFRFMEPEPGRPIGFQHGGDPVWYAELVKRSHRIVKSLDPQARICIGSYEHKKAMEPFVLDASITASLTDGRVSDELRRAFGGHPDSPLSTSAMTKTEVPGQKWTVNDDRNGRRYRIAREDNGLKVTDPKTWFIERLYEEGIQDCHDAMSIHAYGNPFGREWLGTVRRMMVERGDANKPLWVNEYSLHGSGTGLAFNTVRQLRLLRETPWISMAQPLVFASHLDKDISPSGRSLRAHKRMADEYAPRSEKVYDFEGPVLKLLDEWEWDATGVVRDDVDGPELGQEFPHGGQRCLTASTPKNMVRMWFSPYVKAPDRWLKAFVLAEPREKDARLSLTVGFESGDILQDVREVRPFMASAPAERWFELSFPIDGSLPEWKDLTTVTVYVEIQSDKPGLTVSVDDVRVGSGQAAGARR